MMNNAVALQFLRVDWEAQRLAFDVARSKDFFIVPSPHITPILTSFDFTPKLEDSAVPTPDHVPPASHRRRDA